VNKASSALLKQTVTGKHYNHTTLAPNKPKTPVAKKPATNTAPDKTTKPLLNLDGIKGEAKDANHKD